MRFYGRKTKEDLGLGARHCRFDAKDSRVALALLRIADLREDFPHSRYLDYEEAQIRWEMLGQGCLAHRMYAEIARDESAARNLRIGAVRNATLSSPSPAAFVEMRRLADILDPTFRTPEAIDELCRGQQSNADRLNDTAAQQQQAGNHGVAASLADLALSTGVFVGQDEIQLRKVRAQLLRQVDAAAHRHREVIGEQFPPEERLALLEAILEIDRVLALDEWDAESWNFRSAWCLLLRRFEQAITAADRALGLRPTGYAKPHHNRGIALAALKRNDEARGVLQRSLEEARSAGSQQDVELASRTLAGIDAEPPLTPDTFSAVITRLNTASGITQLELFASFYEGKDTNVPSLARSIRDRILVVARDRWHMGYIPVLDELLGDMGPEATFRLLVEMSQDARPVFDYFCRAAMYIAAQGEGAARRDGARLVLLIVLAPERPDEVKSLYRRMVLASAAVSPGPLAKLGQVMKEEIARVHFMLAEFLADQPEVTPAEREAPQALVGELSGPIPSVPYLTEYSRAAGGTHTPLPRAAAVVAWLFWIGILAGFVALARWWF